MKPRVLTHAVISPVPITSRVNVETFCGDVIPRAELSADVDGDLQRVPVLDSVNCPKCKSKIKENPPTERYQSAAWNAQEVLCER